MENQAHHIEPHQQRKRKPEVKKSIRILIAKEKSYMNKFKLRHKIIFAFLVFFGINLLWYGMWMIVSDIPWLNHPIVALIAGAIILIVTGYFYENLISVDFDKKTHKKKPAEEDDS